jgi:predicted permease
MTSRLALTFYRLTIRLYPAEFRRRYGPEMIHDFVERGRLASSTGGVMAAPVFWARATLDVIPSVLRMRTEDAKAAARIRASGTTSVGNGGARGSGPYHERLSTGERGELVMGDLLRDLRYSVRMLVKSPLFTIAAVMTLALGIGLNAATFSTVNGIMLRPLDGARDVDELVQVYRQWAGIEFGSTSIPHYQSIRDRTGEAFESVSAWNLVPLSVSSDERSERTIGMMVSANFFQTYGVQPYLGRAFIPGVEDVDPGAHPVAILGHAFWQSRFGGDPSVVGQTMILNGHPFEIVGVVPEDFRGPVNFAVVPIYVPIMMQREAMPGRDLIESRGNNMMTMVARLRDGATVERAAQVLDAVLLQLKEDFPENYESQLGTTLVPQMEAGIHPSFKSAQLGMSTVMMVVVGLLLLIACVNVANLFLARARERRREMGIRLSLGAGGRRLIQQLLTESVLFSLLSGLVGLGIARVAMGMLGQFRPPIDGPFDFNIPMDGRVLLFTLVVSVLAGLIFGLAPALQAAHPDTVSAVKGESSPKAGRSRVSSGLVVLQMALSLLLLISSGLFLRSLQGATEIDPGFDEPGNLVVASLDPGLQGYDQAQARELFDRLAEQIGALPEVTGVGLTTTLPLGLGSSDRGVGIPGYEFAEGERNSLHYAYVTEGYLEAMGIDVIEGRGFTRQDDEAGAPVIIINERFADRFWPGESALGKIVQTAGADREVVGVVETGKYNSLGEEPTEYMYLPHRERFAFAMTLVVRTPSSPQGVLRRVRETVQTADPNLPLYDVRSMEDHMGIALLPARLGGSVLGMFGVLGLILAAVGIYGVMAYSVAQRTRELGIRVALGASKAAVLKQVLGEGMKLTVIGTVLGLIGAAGAAQLVKGLLYNVNVLDPVAFAGVPLVLVAVAALAVYLPARRAASVEPMKALKTD